MHHCFIALLLHCIISPAKFRPMNPDDLQLLLTREMPFGKHKGCLMADLPGNYLNWFAREGFPKGETGRLLALMQTIDSNGLSALLHPLRKKPPPTGLSSHRGR